MTRMTMTIALPMLTVTSNKPTALVPYSQQETPVIHNMCGYMTHNLSTNYK